MATASSIVLRGLRMLGDKVIGDTLTAAEQTEYLSVLNSMLDSWRIVLEDYRTKGVALQYQKYELKQPKPLLREMLETTFDSEHHRKFRANRSLRDVEPDVNLFLRDLGGVQIEDQA